MKKSEARILLEISLIAECFSRFAFPLHALRTRTDVRESSLSYA